MYEESADIRSGPGEDQRWWRLLRLITGGRAPRQLIPPPATPRPERKPHTPQQHWLQHAPSKHHRGSSRLLRLSSGSSTSLLTRSLRGSCLAGERCGFKLSWGVPTTPRSASVFESDLDGYHRFRQSAASSRESVSRNRSYVFLLLHFYTSTAARLLRLRACRSRTP